MDISKLTLKQYFGLYDIKYRQIVWVANNTIWNIMRAVHSGHRYNKNYKGKAPYYPTESTIIQIAKSLNLSFEDVNELIKNQFKSVRKE